MIGPNLKGRLLYRVMSLSCALAFMLYGYDAGVLGGVQNTSAFLDSMGNPTNSFVIPMIASSYVLAATVMSVGVMFIGMPMGRRRCIITGDCLVIVGAAIQASSFSVGQIIFARCLCGFGVGFISSTVPTFMAEMSIESKERGPEVAIQCAWLISGIPLAYWIDFGFLQLNGGKGSDLSWRIPIAFQSIFAITSLICMLILPDTPRWYYAKGRMDEGDSVLQRLHDLPIDHENVQQQKKEIIDSLELEEHKANRLSLISLIWDNTELRVGRRIRISFLILSIQQMMGINLLVYYSTRIFADIGYSSFTSQLLAAVMNTGFALGTYPLPSTIEKYGRRTIMLWTALGCAISMTVFTIMISLEHQTTTTSWVAVSFVIVYMLFYGYGWVGCPWLYGPEIAPLKYRHIGGAAGSFGEWLFSFITVFAGGIAITNIGWRIWIWQVVACFGVIPFVYFMCPETGGKTLEEIDVLFAKPGNHESGWHAENGSQSEKDAPDISMVEKTEKPEI